jgi:uncharacterized protein YndB with AHSA1/START domain
MTDLTIEREILIEAPADVVWRTITEPDQIEQWFAERVQLDLRPGGAGRFVLKNPETANEVTAPFVVEAVEPPQRFAFRWCHPEGQSPVAGNSTLVEFVLEPVGDERTRLRVLETGVELMPWSDEEKTSFADDHRGGWSVHVGRLGDLLGVAAG